MSYRARSSNEVYASFTCGIEERFPSKDPFSSIMTWIPFQQRPIHVERNRVESQSLYFLEDVEPQIGHGKSVRMEFAGEDEQAFAIYQ